MQAKVKTDARQRNLDTPFSISLFMKCKQYQIPIELVKRLNYNDLLYLIVEYDIETLKTKFRELEQNRQAKRGIVVREATNEEIIKMHEK